MNRLVSLSSSYRFSSSLLIIAIIFTSVRGYGQNAGARGMVSFGKSAGLASDTLYLDVNQDIAVQLLPFEQLLKVAIAYSPLMKYQREVVGIADAATSTTKAQILQNISAGGGYAWTNQSLGGNTRSSVPVTPGTPGTNPDVNTNTSGLQLSNGYRAGVDVRISLFDLFGRKHQIRQAVANQRAAEAQLDVLELQLRQQLITLYQDMITSQQILKVRLLDEQASLAAYRIAEAELQKGTITATAFAASTTQYAQTKSLSEQLKGDFLKQVHFFEALMGVPIQRLKR
ncbi:TolC family protein [Fibrella aestuarina]|nr:TolC family protein [Fibrella aestuarina]